MNMFSKLRVGDIRVPPGRQPVDWGRVQVLAESIQMIGLLHPITVTVDGLLLAGAHRLAAVQELGWEMVDCHIVYQEPFSGAHPAGAVMSAYEELAEIDENLIRNTLDRYEQGRLANHRDALLARLDLRAKVGQGRPKNGAGTAPFLNDRDPTPYKPAPKTTASIAKEIGVSERVLQENKQIARALSDEAIAALRHVDAPKSDALKLARMDAITQGTIAHALLTGNAKTIGDAERLARRQAVEARVITAATRAKSTGVVDIYAASKTYRVIYADPPWSYTVDRQGAGSGVRDHYPTLSLDAIRALPIKHIAQSDAALFLWVPSPLLEQSFTVITDWGFVYKASFVWDKVRHNMGHYNSVRHELLLVGTRGQALPDRAELYDSVQSIERTTHSAKPPCFRSIIERLYPLGARLELFARDKPDGWDVWGYEAP